MNKIISIIIFLTMLCGFKADTISAFDNVAGQSANLITKVTTTDTRIYELKTFLLSYNSPLVEYADDFIIYADKYQLDWRLVPAISGVESTFGKNIPFNSYNAYGWANGNYSFDSWTQSIEIVNRTLREKYINRGADSISEIARIYAPPSTTWASKVKYFINKIDSIPLDYSI